MTSATRLFVGNLPEQVNENDLRNAFSRFGKITALEIKNKPASEEEKKHFAFVTLSASNYNIESCIKHFSNADFNGCTLYVTRARESFLERLQREREQAKRKEFEKNEQPNTKHTPGPLNININSYKRKHETNNLINENSFERNSKKKFEKEHDTVSNHMDGDSFGSKNIQSADFKKESFGNDYKKQNSDKMRLESMRKKRQEFNEKKNIIKIGLFGIDKAPNKKVIFSDIDEDFQLQNGLQNNSINNTVAKKKRTLFEEGDDSDNEVNFEVKKQFEGKKGQKVLDLQSRYKADKRFVLDERFVEEEKSDEEYQQTENKDEGVESIQVDEKYKQLNILQDVLGVPIKINQPQETSRQIKSKMGMLRFDPTQPEHAKFLAPVITKQERQEINKSKKKKSKEIPEEIVQEQPNETEKVEVSKEQFYKVSETLKEAMTQPSSFSLRSLFGKEDNAYDDIEKQEQNVEYKISESTKERKVKNPLDPGEKNPFVYDSSESENEEDNVEEEAAPQVTEAKPVWKEKLFFSISDCRLKEGLLFFTQTNAEKAHKDRRELKSVMKKRVYNKERKNQMFQKKIGGRRKNAKKSYRKKT